MDGKWDTCNTNKVRHLHASFSLFKFISFIKIILTIHHTKIYYLYNASCPPSSNPTPLHPIPINPTTPSPSTTTNVNHPHPPPYPSTSTYPLHSIPINPNPCPTPPPHPHHQSHTLPPHLHQPLTPSTHTHKIIYSAFIHFSCLLHHKERD